MELRDYARILLKRGWIIILVSIITAVSAVAFSKMQTVIYRSTARLQVIPARYDYGLTLAADKLLRQFGLQIETTTMAQKVIDQLQLDISPEKLRERVTVRPIPEDFVIQIDVDYPDPATAQAIASTLAEEYVNYHTAQSVNVDKSDRIEIRLLEGAKYGWVHWPKTKTLAVAGAILGIMLGSIMAFGLEYLESDVLRSSEDVERYVGIPVVGSIPTITASEADSEREQRRRWRIWRRG